MIDPRNVGDFNHPLVTKLDARIGGRPVFVQPPPDGGPANAAAWFDENLREFHIDGPSLRNARDGVRADLRRQAAKHRVATSDDEIEAVLKEAGH